MPVFSEALRAGQYFNSEMLFVGAGASLYICSFLLWLILLAKNDLSVAYPIAAGLTLVCSSFAASSLLDEQITLGRILGIAVIFVGIWLVARS